MSLSDNIVDLREINKKAVVDVCFTEDIKQAVKELKERIHDFVEYEIGDIARNKVIDEIFGDKLNA